MDTIRSYIYPVRLSEGYIRLLSILPQTPGNHTFLNLDLRVTALPPQAGHNPRYLALSYLWGPEDQQKKLVYINGQPFQVGINLYIALVHLASNISLLIWIDAVCINQNDSEEKGVQVNQMGAIYGSAEEVLIWLGEGTPETDNLLVQMDSLGARALGAGIWNLEPEDMKRWPNIEFQKSHIKSSLEQLMSSVRRGAKFPFNTLIDLSYRPWFKRVWIVQELCLGVRYRFICGQSSVPGDNFIAAFYFCVLFTVNDLGPLKQAGQGGTSLLLGMAKALIKNPSMFVGAIQRTVSKQHFMISPRASTTLGTRRKFQSRDSLTLMQLLVRAFILTSDGPLEAKVAKDRVYAFLGIAKDRDKLGIYPDYRNHTTYQQVYIQVARALVRVGRLDILGLCRATHPRGEPDAKVQRDPVLPSWVPDWSQPMTPAWSECFEDGIYHAWRRLPDNGTRTAANQLPPPPPLTPNTLRLKTMFVGTVMQLGSPWTPHWETSFDYATAHRFIQEIEHFLAPTAANSRIYSDQQRIEGVWRIPVGDKELNSVGLVTRATGQSYQAYIELRKFMSATSENQQYASLASAGGIWATYMATMKDMWDAKPILTDQGFVGLCPAGTIQGDEIYLPVGAHVPYVFRRVSSTHRCLIGEVFLYGAMDGELSCPEQHLCEIDVL
jgi:hypothetical protein